MLGKYTAYDGSAMGNAAGQKSLTTELRTTGYPGAYNAVVPRDDCSALS